MEKTKWIDEGTFRAVAAAYGIAIAPADEARVTEDGGTYRLNVRDDEMAAALDRVDLRRIDR